MSAKELLAIGVRLLGIWLIVSSLNSLTLGVSYVIGQAWADKTISSSFMMYLPFLGLAIGKALIGFLLIKFPYFVASKLIPKTNVDNTQINWEEKLVERIGFVLLGVYILSWAIPDLIHIVVYFVQNKDYSPNGTIDFATNKLNFIVTLVEISIGLFLILGSQGVVNVIHKIRS